MIELKGRVAYGRPVVTRRQIALAATADSVAGVRRDISPRRIKLSSTALGGQVSSARERLLRHLLSLPPPPRFREVTLRSRRGTLSRELLLSPFPGRFPGVSRVLARSTDRARAHRGNVIRCTREGRREKEREKERRRVFYGPIIPGTMKYGGNLITAILCVSYKRGRGLKKQTREPHTSILIIIINDPRDSPPSPMHRRSGRAERR